MADIVITGLASNDPVPGEYIDVAFAQGIASNALGSYAALIIANMLSSGAGSTGTVYGPDTAIPMLGEDDAIQLFGAGSEAHRMVRRFLSINQSTPLYVVCVAENGSAQPATGTITITGPATASGTLRIYVADEFVDVGFAKGDTATVIGDNAVTQVTAKSHWPVTVTNASGVLTLTTKQKGARANLVRYFARLIPFTGSGVSVTPVASTAMSSGSASDDLTTITSTISAQRFYYMVPAANDSTQLSALASFINAQAVPTVGLRERMVAGSADTLANSLTITDGINGARAEVLWLYQSDVPPCELAASGAAAYALGELPDPPRLNFNGYGQGDGEAWPVKAPLSGAAPTRSQIAAALNGGLSPVGVNRASTYIVKRVTTRYKNGAVLDYRIRDPHKVTIADRYADTIKTTAAAELRGKSIGDDPKKNEPTPGPSVVTPRVLKTLCNRITDSFAGNDLLQNVPDIKAQTVAQRNSANRARMDARVPLQPIDILDQVGVRVDQVA